MPTSDFKYFLKSSFVVAAFVLIIVVGVFMFAFNFMFNGQVTFTIKNGTDADIQNVQVIATGFKARTGKLAPGQSQTYKFECHRECSAELDVEFNPSRTYKMENLCYLDGMEANCEFLLLDETLEVRHRNPRVRKGHPGDGTPQGVGVHNYETKAFVYDEKRD